MSINKKDIRDLIKEVAIQHIAEKKNELFVSKLLTESKITNISDGYQTYLKECLNVGDTLIRELNDIYNGKLLLEKKGKNIDELTMTVGPNVGPTTDQNTTTSTQPTSQQPAPQPRITKPTFSTVSPQPQSTFGSTIPTAQQSAQQLIQQQPNPQPTPQTQQPFIPLIPTPQPTPQPIPQPAPAPAPAQPQATTPPPVPQSATTPPQATTQPQSGAAQPSVGGAQQPQSGTAQPPVPPVIPKEQQKQVIKQKAGAISKALTGFFDKIKKASGNIKATATDPAKAKKLLDDTIKKIAPSLPKDSKGTLDFIRQAVQKNPGYTNVAIGILVNASRIAGGPALGLPAGVATGMLLRTLAGTLKGEQIHHASLNAAIVTMTSLMVGQASKGVENIDGGITGHAADQAAQHGVDQAHQAVADQTAQHAAGIQSGIHTDNAWDKTDQPVVGQATAPQAVDQSQQAVAGHAADQTAQQPQSVDQTHQAETKPLATGRHHTQGWNVKNSDGTYGPTHRQLSAWNAKYADAQNASDIESEQNKPMMQQKVMDIAQKAGIQAGQGTQANFEGGVPTTINGKDVTQFLTPDDMQKVNYVRSIGRGMQRGMQQPVKESIIKLRKLIRECKKELYQERNFRSGC